MGKIIILIFCSTVLFSCKKDKTCAGLTIEGDRTEVLGKWRWYKTRIRQWFDIGSDIFYDYTPKYRGL